MEEESQFTALPPKAHDYRPDRIEPEIRRRGCLVGYLGFIAWQFVLNGSSLSLYLNGSTMPLVTANDSTLSTAGGIGIFAFGPGGTVNNFVVGGA